MEESVKVVVEALKPVAEKIGQGAQALFEIYTKQMVAEGIATFIGVGTALVLLIVCIVIGAKLFKHGQDLGKAPGAGSYDGEGFMIFGAVVPGLIGLICLIMVCVLPAQAAMRLMNPQYYAIERLVEQATDKKE